MEKSEPKRKFIVLMVSPSALRIPEGERWDLRELPGANGGTLNVVLTGHYVEEGFSCRVPRGICAEVSGFASNFGEALQVFARAADFLAPILSLAASCHVPQFRHRLAYETTEGSKYLQFRQWFVIEDHFPQLGPRAAFEPFVQILDKYLTHAESLRIYRAMVQYQEALASWRLGEELRAVMHLWMAVEALTKSFLRQETQWNDMDETRLCSKWGIEKKHLDGEVRKRLIFHGDNATYDGAKNTSDGVEHMFKDFPDLHRMSAAVRDKTAQHVRSSLLNLLGVVPASDVSASEVPQDLTRFDGCAVSGCLESGAAKLAADGYSHPMMAGRYAIESFVAKGDGYDVRIKNNFQIILGPGVKFHAGTVGADLPLSELEVSVKKAEQ